MRTAGERPDRRRRLPAAPVALALALLAGGAAAQQGPVPLHPGQQGYGQQGYAQPARPFQPAAPAQATPQGPAALTARLMELEEELRRMRGRVEELEYQQGRLQQRQDDLLADVDRRLSAVDGSRTPPAATDPAAQPETTAAGGAAPAAAVSGAGAAAAAQQAATRPAEGSKARYDQALALLQGGDWQGAQQVFESFLESWPEDALAPNAAYWLGETHYIRRDFEGAAARFARNYQTYGGDAPKAADNLLKLGMSLGALGDVDKACQTFAELDKRHPNAPAAITQALARERAAAGCD